MQETTHSTMRLMGKFDCCLRRGVMGELAEETRGVLMPINSIECYDISTNLSLT